MGLKIRRLKNGFAYYAEYKLGRRGVIYEKIEANTKKQATKIYAARIKELRGGDPDRKSVDKTLIKPSRAISKTIGSRSVLALNVVRLRKAAEMSQEELAIAAEIDRTYISQIERGTRNVSIDIIDALARSLQMTTIALLSPEAEFK